MRLLYLLPVPDVDGGRVRIHPAPQGDPLSAHPGGGLRAGQKHRGVWKKKQFCPVYNTLGITLLVFVAYSINEKRYVLM